MGGRRKGQERALFFFLSFSFQSHFKHAYSEDSVIVFNGAYFQLSVYNITLMIYCIILI